MEWAGDNGEDPREYIEDRERRQNVWPNRSRRRRRNPKVRKSEESFRGRRSRTLQTDTAGEGRIRDLVGG